MYAIANTLNRGLYVKNPDEDNSSKAVVKFAVLVLIAVISVFAAINLFSHKSVGSTVVGYYLIGFGFISLIEPYMLILIKNDNNEKVVKKSLKNHKIFNYILLVVLDIGVIKTILLRPSRRVRSLFFFGETSEVYL